MLFLAVMPISRSLICIIQAYFYVLHGFTNEVSFTGKLFLFFEFCTHALLFLFCS